MRIGIASVQVPFISGGAEDLQYGLECALRNAGHEVELITMPFRFSPVSEVKRSMDIWSSENFEEMNGYRMDRVICLKFPTYYLRHSDKVVWLMHQHRSVYELWGPQYSELLSETSEGQSLKQEIMQRDTESLLSCPKIYTISGRVSARLEHFNKIKSTPLYHPPRLANRFYTKQAEPYVFFPSRLEDHKRQHLLIEAMKHVKTPIAALIAGNGGKKDELQRMVDRLNISKQVRLLGRITDDELLAYYAHCLGVFFGPYDEDYGLVTLEAMLSAKSVITCTDSGGSLEFVEDGKTGFVVDPVPQAIAEKIDWLYFHKNKSADIGMAGKKQYERMNISWDHVVQTLLE